MGEHFEGPSDWQMRLLDDTDDLELFGALGELGARGIDLLRLRARAAEPGAHLTCLAASARPPA
jgi:hypothetical protein